jgi:hypothetical protein
MRLSLYEQKLWFYSSWPSLYPHIFPLEFSSSAYPSRNDADLKLALFFICLSKRDCSMKLFCPVLSTNVLYKISWDHRVHAEWHLPLSDVHSIMMVKLTQHGKDWGVHAHPFSLYLPSRTKLGVRSSLKVRYPPPPPVSTLPPYMYSVVGALRLFVGKERMSCTLCAKKFLYRQCKKVKKKKTDLWFQQHQRLGNGRHPPIQHGSDPPDY